MKTIILLFFIPTLSFATVTWQQQAERLQKISTTLTEATPVVTPVTDKHFDILMDISLLPKLNSTVGSKKEDTKAPPIHGVPIIRWNHAFNDQFSSRLWAGALPSFAASFLTEHKVNQYLIGLEGQLKSKFNSYFSFGYQLSSSSIKGNITEDQSNDEMTSVAGIMYLGAGQNLSLGFWGLTLGARRNDSEFYIQVDETTYKFSDQLEDSTIPLYYQGTIGSNYKSFTFAFTQLYIPRRILMPKFSIIYSW